MLRAVQQRPLKFGLVTPDCCGDFPCTRWDGPVRCRSIYRPATQVLESVCFGTRRGLEQAFNSLDAAAGDLHHVFREPESGGRGIAAAIAAGPRSRAPKSRCIRARIPVLASLPLVPRNQDIEHRRETSHRKPCGVIRAPRRPLSLDEQPELLPKEKIHCGEGAARAAQGCERMRQRPGQ